MEKIILASIRYAIVSMVVATNFNEDLEEEEKESVLNTAFNGLVNGLSPEYQEYALDIILHYSESYKDQENKEMFDSIGWEPGS